MDKNRMTTREVAEYSGYACGSLHVFRTWGTGPKYYKERNRVYYRKEDVDAWLKTRGVK